jgi:Ca2+-transporting ATPase
VPGLHGDDARARRLEHALEGRIGVARVKASPRTGRVLVLVSDDHATSAVRDAVDAETDPDARPPPSIARLRETLRKAGASALRTAEAELRRRHRVQTPIAEQERSPSSPAYHALSADEVASELGVDPHVGLEPQDADARRAVHGPNVLAGIEPRSRVAIVAGQALTVPNAILAASSGLSAVLGDMLESAAIAAVVATNVAIGSFTEARAEELLHAWGELRVERARVLRGGREMEIPAAIVVPGDALVLYAGEPVAADARVVVADDLSADESTLTGESEASEKSPAAVAEDAQVADRDSMVFAGTVIASGSGLAIVTATGERTELGGVRRALAGADERRAPLEQQLDALGRRLAVVSGVAAGGVVGLGILGKKPLADVAKCAVALGVAAIPEGIPTSGTTALALASRRLSRRGIVIRRLAAAETLGAVSVVCADKTGTLTLNHMRVEELYLPEAGLVRVVPSSGAVALEGTSGRLSPASVRDLARVLALNADVEIGEDGAVKRGSGTERALAEFAMAVGFPARRERRRARRVREERRSAERAFMVTVHDDPELGCIDLVKGAPEQVIELCDLDRDGAKAARRENAAMAGRGLRVLACGWRRRDDGRYAFLGLVGLRDPPRPGVREAILALSRAGIRTWMLTGDQERTARAVAKSLGIEPGAVMSRVTPEAKLDVVRELQERGRIVAMTGDGVNDGPALRAADVGIAMGQRGTDIARAVADVVLARDDLPAIAEAVAEGRRLYDNVRRAIDYLCATNASEVMVMLAGGLAREGPLSPLQLLWLNMLTDVVPALALAVEPAEKDIMERPPRDPAEPLLAADAWQRLGRASAEMASAALAAWVLGAARQGRGVRPSAMAFTALGTAQILHTRACRSNAPHDGSEGRALSATLVATAGLQVLALAAPPLRSVLSIGSTGALDLGLAAVIGAAPFAARWARSSRRPDEIVIEPAPRTKTPPHPVELLAREESVS